MAPKHRESGRAAGRRAAAVAALLALAAAPVARGAILAQETFDSYSAGSANLSGQGSAANGFNGAYTNSVTAPTSVTTTSGSVTAGSLVFPGSSGSGAGNRATFVGSATNGASAVTDYRDLGTTYGGAGDNGLTYWVGFLMRMDNTGNRFAGVSFDNSGASNTSSDGEVLFLGKGGGLTVFSATANNTASNASNTAQTTVSATDGQVHLVVAKITFASPGNDTLRLFIDPSPAAGTPPDASALATLSANDFSFNRIRAGAGSNNGTSNQASMSLDEFRIGQSFADVAVPEPSSLALLAGAGAGLLARRRRRA